MLFMFLCVGFIGSVIVLEAGPVYAIFMARLRGIPLSMAQWIWIAVSFLLVSVINTLAVLWPMRLGCKSLTELEQ
jgi:ABC-2 type transport system permease protein